MENAFVVSELKRVADFWDDCQCLLGSEAAGTHRLAEVRAIHILHQQIEKAVGPAEVVDGDDVGMVEASQKASFASESLGEPGIGGGGLGQNFQSDEAFKFGLARFIDKAHA